MNVPKMNVSPRAVVLIGLFVTALPEAGKVHAADVLSLATTTSTENSGLLAHIHPDFEKKTGIRVKVIAKGTGAALQLARDGNADVVLVHARRLEDRFVAEGFGVMRRDVMFNDFVIIGPASDPAGIRDARTVAEAMRRLAAGEHTFISRGDGSGTHVKEQDLWRHAAVALETKTVRTFSRGRSKEQKSVRPRGKWYLSIGQGMGKAITMATERRAYTLTDRGTYHAFAMAEPARTDLAVLSRRDLSRRDLSRRDRALYNPYGVIAVNPAKHPHVNFPAVKQYIQWLTSAEVRKMIADYRVGGKVLFHPFGDGGKEDGAKEDGGEE